MAFKKVTRDTTKYWINLDQVAYIRQHEDGSSPIQFAAVADHSSSSLQVDQSPDESFTPRSRPAALADVLRPFTP